MSWVAGVQDLRILHSWRFGGGLGNTLLAFRWMNFSFEALKRLLDLTEARAKEVY